MKIVADKNIPYLKGVLEPFADVVYLDGKNIRNENLVEADCLIVRTRTKCDENLLQGTKVRFIATATIGFDHIDTLWCEQNKIIWTNAPGCNAGSVYQYVAASLVVLAKKLGFNFEDRSLGIIGVGNVGRKIVKLGEWLGMRVLLCDPPKARNEGKCGYVSFESILRECDIITCHVPLNPDGKDKTLHLISEEVLNKINNDTIIINTSRGEVVDNKALKNALQSGQKIQGTIIDVWENEPDIDSELVDLTDIATPHIAGYSADGKINATTMTIHSISKFFNLPLTRWKPENLPVPGNVELKLNCKGRLMQDLLSEAIQFTYDITADDTRLRSSPGEFELLRSSYPLRREFKSYTVNLQNESGDIRKRLCGLGFNVV